MNVLNSICANILFIFKLGELISHVTFIYIIIGTLFVISIVSLIIRLSTLKAKSSRKKFEYYKKIYPNAFSIFSYSEHAYPRTNYDEFNKKEIKEILSYQIEEWISTEKREIERIEKEKFIIIKHNEIKNKYPDGLNCWKQTYPNTTKEEIASHYLDIMGFDIKYKDFLFMEEWESEQNYYSKLCRSQVATMSHCSCCSNNIDFPKVNYKGEKMNAEYIVWQFFFFEFCMEENLDYTYFQHIKDNYQNDGRGDWSDGLGSYISYEIVSFVKSLNRPVEIILTEDNLGENPQMFIIYFDLNKNGYKTKHWRDIESVNNKYIIVIDTTTTNEQLHFNCELINKKCKVLRPCIAYVSLMKEYSREEMQNLINKKNAEIEKRKIEEENRAQISKDIDILTEATKSANIELAEKKIKILKEKLQNPAIDKEIEKIVSSKELEFRNQYTEGISDNLGIHYVDYLIPIQFIQESENWRYPVARFPQKGNIVFPYRRRSIARRGYMELSFQSYLQSMLGSQLLVIGDCSILPAENYRPYEPDIAIIDLKKPSIRIDIEIDEPYSAISNQPIHFIGCGDDFRDINLNNLGWIVMRFTEYQVVSNMKGCAASIAQIIYAINPNISICSSLLTYSLPDPVKRWSDIEAKVMVSEKLREKYLNHEFGIKEIEQITSIDISQNSIEKHCATLVKPLVINRVKSSIITNLNVAFQRDRDIQFLPFEHIYLYKGSTRLVPVSNIISYFFKPFDSFYWSSSKAMQRGVPQGQILEEWDEKGARSREVGTFMHRQIENCYNELEYKNEYHFRYIGKYIITDQYIDLGLEHEQFNSFRCKHSFTPFRTEWAVYDERLKIAGTIDMIYKKDEEYDIYDWKRSHHIVNSVGEPISTNSYGGRGIHGLENIHDTKYWRYCLQQNLYRFILEKKYRIKVDKMYLVIFVDNTTSYTKLEVPRMDDEIKVILDFCSKNNIVQLLLN
ncbi:hypothetical protein [Bacteroides graminisolvens]|uniref:hypothetical protein n=1 Tax=Bacteroides graminisolvens TaxID=477666 RepID=UPI001B6B82C4|nr:hypothetical protein [Bacteroides graminisolvens]MBP7359700.1 hypothetical protein [Prevotella sp.]MDD3211832.1 hypothetical protein [Bacteroides graminisolvens]